MITLRKAVLEDLSLVNRLLLLDDWLAPETSFDEEDFSYILEYSPKDFRKALKNSFILIVFDGSNPIGLIELTHILGQEKVISWNVSDTSLELNELILKKLKEFNFNANSLCIYTYDPIIEPIMLRNGFKKNVFNFFVYDYKRRKKEA